jgi:anti-sigma factor RsiW
MNRDACGGDEIVELYFYDELSDGDRAAVEAHLSVCPACREALDDLRAIETALASRAVDAPPLGDWSGFTRRLEARLNLANEGSRGSTGSIGSLGSGGVRWAWLNVAAAVALVAAGVLAGWTMSRFAPAAPRQAEAVRPAPDAAIADAGDFGLERARVVLAGLAQKEDGAEWSLERRMAASLLPEVRLIRQAAAARGRAGLEDILIDVETLLLQASYAETDDAATLSRLRNMIDRRDMLIRLSMAATEKKGI